MRCMPPVDLKYLAHLWTTGMRSDRICVELNCTRGHLFNLVRKHRLGRRPKECDAPRYRETPDPTEEEIAQMTAAIRATWTLEERMNRQVGFKRQRVEIRNYNFDREQYSFSS
jgi:hypothetical protein